MLRTAPGSPSVFLISSLVVLIASGCGDDVPAPDAGIEDAGFVVPPDAGPSDASTMDTGSGDSGQPSDGGVLDDAGDSDAAVDDAGLDDVGTDAGIQDTGPADMGTDAGPADLGTDAGLGDAGADAGPDAGPNQLGGLVFSELAPRGPTEWLEITNVSNATVSLDAHTLNVTSSGLVAAPIRAITDPTGTASTAVEIGPGQALVGVPNPASGPIVGTADFVFGTAGAGGADALSEVADTLELVGPAGLVDRLEYRSTQTATTANVGLGDLPLHPDVAVQLDVDVLGDVDPQLENDDVTRWCAPWASGDSPGQTNIDCDALVLSEVLYDFDSLTRGADGNNVFVEIGGPAGASLADVVVTAVRLSDGQVRDSVTITADRLPMNGLYVVADGTGGLTEVQNADQVVDFDPRNSEGALQLIRDSGGLAVLLDVFAHGSRTVDVDASRGLATFEGTEAIDIDTRVFPACYARSDELTDTDDNLADFEPDPSPTPGEQNGEVAMTLTAVSPTESSAQATATLTFEGSDLMDFMTIHVGTVAVEINAVGSPCQFQSETQFTCPITPASATTGSVDVTLDARPESNEPSSTLTDGFLWTP